MKIIHSCQIFLFLFVLSCMDRFVIPSDIDMQGSGEFVAGDTVFLQINPPWNNSYGFDQPEEISVAQDGRVFVADKGNNSIIVLNQDGSKPTGFERLISLEDRQGNPIVPIDVDIDNKMNVFIIDGSERIFMWNQYWSDMTIERISSSGTFNHTQSNLDTTVSAGSNIWVSLLNDNEWTLVSAEMSENQILIDSLTRPHLFYDGKNEMNIFLDNYYQADSSRFNALTVSPGQENMIFATDNYGGNSDQYRVVQIDFYRSLILELSSGETVWAFTGRFGGTIKGFGTGAGTVNQPLGLDVDYQGNLYYTQAGDYFPVHMISPNLSGDFATYTSGFQPEADDIMDPSRFLLPLDVAVDNNRNIYIVDKQNRDVTVFNSYGDFFKKAGYQQDSLSIMNQPVAVTVDQKGIVYVCDQIDGTVYRYKLSNTLDEDITPED